MAVSTKLAELDIRETSGVDHPAHLHEGWLVIKSAADSDAETDEGENPEMELDVTEETVVEEAVAEEPTPVAASVAGPDAELRKELTDLRKELSAMRAEKERIEAEADLAKAVETAGEFAILPEVDVNEFGALLVDLRKNAPEAAEKIESVLKASARALAEAGVLKELGADAAEETHDAWGKIESLANDLVAAGEAPSFAKAVSLVATRDKDLYNTYLIEKGL
ncbi:MAG: Arthrobacter phage Laroye [Actinomycetota bacterium]|jgi:hypothetical protein